MLQFVGQLTLDSKNMTERDVQGLREAGFDDVQILEVTQLAAWFNYINRVADALGAQVEPWRASWQRELLEDLVGSE